MSTRTNEFVAAFNYLKEQKALEDKKLRDNIEESVKHHQSELDRIYNIRESREMRIKEHNKLLENCKNEALATCIKAIYIEALDPGALTDNGIIIAEDLVDSWIKAKGGASKIIAENRNKNYLINRICNIAEETALREVEEVENVGKEDETANSAGAPTTDEEKKNAKVTQLMAQAQALIAKATAIQNGEDVSDDTESNDTDTSAENSEGEDSGEKIDAADLEVEETEGDEDPLSNPDLGDGDDESTESKEEDSDSKDKEESDDTSAENSEEDDSEESNDDDSDNNDEEDSDEEDEDDGEADPDDLDVEDDDDSDDEEDEDDDIDEDPLSNPDLGDGDDESTDSEDVEDDGSEDGSDITGDEDVDDSEDEEEVTVNSNSDDSKAKIFDDLEKEEDVKKAVELIRQRVADAEEDFIKRNAEDKKQIDDLLGKISDNIKTVENISDNDSPKSKVAQEAIQINTRKIKNITETRTMRVFEKIVRNLSESVVKDKTLNESYMTESGQLDVAAVVESAKIIYGFLECLNTIGLEKIDREYLQNVLNNI